MQQLNIPFIQLRNNNDYLPEISALLDCSQKQVLEYNLWPSSNIQAKAFFAIAHNNHSIFLKYFVEEKYIRACETNINGKVWEDSCVEFFISFADEPSYYNFEFNCLGTGLVGFGNSKQNRELLPNDIVNNIMVAASMEDTLAGNKYWELTIAIPPEIFIHHNISSFSGMEGHANFFKCGDLLPIPHFLAWSNIESPEPNFHLPEYFGEIRFL